MEINKDLAFNLAIEEITRLVNDNLVYKTMMVQRDNIIKELQDKIRELEENK